MELKLIRLEKIDSTNDYAKKLDFNHNLTCYVISEIQTKGKGRDGRNFLSKKGGLYFSIVKDDVENIDNPYFITQIAGVAIYEALKKFGVYTLIKWPNDIILNKKKLAGILTEYINIKNEARIICGIGLNLENDISEIEGATSLKEENFNLNKEILLDEIINSFEKFYEKYKIRENSEIIQILNKKSAIVGKNIFILRKSGNKIALALKINDDGSLLVEYNDGRRENLFSGEISIREN